MFSLSNYLTNRSETALISAYCSASLNTASLGGLSGKLWCRDQQDRQAEKGEQQNSRVRSQEPIHPSLRTCSVSYESFPHLLQPCPIQGGSTYGLTDSHHLNTFENIEELDIVLPCPTNINVHIGVIIYYDMLMHGQGRCGSWDGEFNKLQKS